MKATVCMYVASLSTYSAATCNLYLKLQGSMIGGLVPR